MSKNNKYLNFLLIIIFSLISFFIYTDKSFAATLNFSINSIAYKIGDIVEVKINVQSDISINAVSGSVLFDDNILSLISTSKSSSILNFWPKENVFNKNNSVNFEGIILDGYIGNEGNIITLIFKAKKNGQAFLKFNDIKILANDGYGTDVFRGDLSNIFINIEETKESPIFKNRILEEKSNLGIFDNLFLIKIIILILLIILIYLLIVLLKRKKQNKEKIGEISEV